MSGLFGEPVERSKLKGVEWYTPEWVFQELGLQFDLDPCSPHDAETYVPANTKYTIFDDGLMREWFGRVWLNPPYGRETPQWINRMVDHGNGVVMVFSRTDAAWCQSAMRAADSMLFIQGRVNFVPGIENRHKAKRSGAGTLMLAFGEENAEALQRLGYRGILVSNRRTA